LPYLKTFVLSLYENLLRQHFLLSLTLYEHQIGLIIFFISNLYICSYLLSQFLAIFLVVLLIILQLNLNDKIISKRHKNIINQFRVYFLFLIFEICFFFSIILTILKTYAHIFSNIRLQVLYFIVRFQLKYIKIYNFNLKMCFLL